MAYGSFYDTTTQTAGPSPTPEPTPMRLNTTDRASGVSIVDFTKISVASAGVYNIQFSAQVQRTGGSGTKAVDIWLDKNGTAVADTNTQVLLSSSGVDSREVAAWNFFICLTSSDYARLMWKSADVHNEFPYVSPSPNPGSTPPGIPSLIVTVTQVAATSSC